MSDPLNESEARQFIANEVNSLLTSRVKQLALIFGVANVLAFAAILASVKAAAQSAAIATAQVEVETQRAKFHTIAQFAIEQSLQVTKESQSMFKDLGRTAVALDNSRATASSIGADIDRLSARVELLKSSLQSLRAEELTQMIADIRTLSDSHLGSNVVTTIAGMQNAVESADKRLGQLVEKQTSQELQLDALATRAGVLSTNLLLIHDFSTSRIATITSDVASSSSQIAALSILYQATIEPVYNVFTQMVVDAKGCLYLRKTPDAAKDK